MNNFSFEKLDIEGAYIIKSFYAEDNRGCFVKNFEKDLFEENGIAFQCQEDFVSHSVRNVIRGMHFQLYHPQTKLVGVISGEVFDVLVDLREESKTYGQWEGAYLSAENRSSLLIPKGCAHGFLSLSDDSIVSYKCEGRYDKNTDMGIIFSDPDIHIEWPNTNSENFILSERDKHLMTFREFQKNCRFEYE